MSQEIGTIAIFSYKKHPHFHKNNLQQVDQTKLLLKTYDSVFFDDATPPSAATVMMVAPAIATHFTASLAPVFFSSGIVIVDKSPFGLSFNQLKFECHPMKYLY